MVKNGLAYVYHRYLSDFSETIKNKLIKAENYARINYLGVWSLTNAIMPEDYRIINKE